MAEEKTFIPDALAQTYRDVAAVTIKHADGKSEEATYPYSPATVQVIFNPKGYDAGHAYTYEPSGYDAGYADVYPTKPVGIGFLLLCIIVAFVAGIYAARRYPGRPS